MKFLDTNKVVYFGWFMLVFFFFNPTEMLLVAAESPFLSYSFVLTAYVFSFIEVKVNMVRKVSLNV